MSTIRHLRSLYLVHRRRSGRLASAGWAICDLAGDVPPRRRDAG